MRAAWSREDCVSFDQVARDFSAQGPNELWLTSISEHRTGEGKLTS